METRSADAKFNPWAALLNLTLPAAVSGYFLLFLAHLRDLRSWASGLWPIVRYPGACFFIPHGELVLLSSCWPP